MYPLVSTNPVTLSYTSTYASPLGQILLNTTNAKLTGLWFAEQKYFGSTLGMKSVIENRPIFLQVKAWLDVYFRGEIPREMPPLEFQGTAFQKLVWQELCAIPYGQTDTYAQITKRVSQHLGRRTSPRAVGSAIARNPISILVPCHRVIGTNGRLTGYAGGLERKIYLLKLEGVLLDAWR